MCGCNTPDTTPATAVKGGTTFKVPDMSCGHCVGTIRTALEAGMPGAAVAIDLETHLVTVAGDADRAEAVIRDAGYDPHRAH